MHPRVMRCGSATSLLVGSMLPSTLPDWSSASVKKLVTSAAALAAASAEPCDGVPMDRRVLCTPEPASPDDPDDRVEPVDSADSAERMFIAKDKQKGRGAEK